jgi:hypothetical protein
MSAGAVVRAGSEIEALAFTAEASRAYLAQFRRIGGVVDEQLTGATVCPVTTGRLRPHRAAGWSQRGD